jgi:hypothetical protein
MGERRLAASERQVAAVYCAHERDEKIGIRRDRVEARP